MQCRLVLIMIAVVFTLSFAYGKASVAPMDEYELTLTALEQYRVLAAEDDGAILPDTEKPVEAGDHYAGVPRLIRLLGLIGDLPGNVVNAETDVYEGALVAAVQRFQRRHGLEPDGRIDKMTLTQLNIPLGFRVRQLELALERWRRRPYDPSRPAIVLNVPEFRLRAARANHVDLEMKIIVGQAPDRKTPLLTSELGMVVFRPHWDVPLSIQRDELVPEMAKDTSFLPANHLEIITPQGDLVQKMASDAVVAQLRSGRLRLRQTPGPKNVLGLAKFIFPNAYGIYMHDTSAPWLFARARRDLSHGCIRVEKVADLAEWVLRDETDWTRARIVKAMNASESVAVKIARPVQLVIMYVTAVVLENGEVHFFDDIYGEDEILEKALAGSNAASSRHPLADVTPRARETTPSNSGRAH